MQASSIILAFVLESILFSKDRVMMHNPEATLYGAEGYDGYQLAQIKKEA